jgi:PhoPQ-activated pathogenicity-related protein
MLLALPAFSALLALVGLPPAKAATPIRPVNISSAIERPGAQAVPRELYDYLRQPDASYSFTAAAPADVDATVGASVRRFSLVSQTWQGIKWEHEVVVVSPEKPAKGGTALLIITGGKSNEKDLTDAWILSRVSGLPVATLFQIPNQPLYGMKEDDLIAHTFEEFLKSGDPTWPLLFPMTKSAIRAMDGLEKAMGIHRFVVTGASKRGWTTWLTGASGDRRVIGIAPIVYDNLNLLKQMPHQFELWGHYSPQIEDYTRRGLQEVMKTAPGQRLGRIVDPYSYLPNVKAPILTISGANDPYWAPDAYSVYGSELPGSTRNLVLPNEAHTFKDKSVALNTLGLFARSCAEGKVFPKATARVVGDEVVVSGDKELRSKTLVVAESDTWDFHEATWQVVPGMTVPASSKNRAAIVLFGFRTGFGVVVLSSPILLVR